MGFIIDNIRLRRGARRNLPASAEYGEPLFTGDSHELYVGMGTGVPLVNVTRAMSTMVFCFQAPAPGQRSNKVAAPFVKDVESVTTVIDGTNTSEADMALYINDVFVSNIHATGESSTFVLPTPVELAKGDIVQVLLANMTPGVITITAQVNAE